MDSQERKALLRSHPCFSSLTDDELTTLTALLSFHTIPTRTIIVAENELIDSLYFIASGRAEVRLDIPIATMTTGEAIGLSETDFYSTTGQRTATVIAITEMRLLRLSIAGFNTFLQQHESAHRHMRQNAHLFQRMNLIKHAAPFATLSANNIHTLANQMHERNFAAGQIIFNKNDAGDQCYLIQSGKVEIFLPEEDGRELRLATLTSPNVFGEAAIYMNMPRNASARAINDCRLLALDRDSLLHIVKTHATVADSLMSLLHSRSRPLRLPYVECHKQPSQITLKNEQDGSYYRLSEEGFFIWQLLDGKHTLRDISLAFHHQYDVFDPGLVSSFIMDLELEGFVEDRPGEGNVNVDTRSPMLRAAAYIKRIMEASISIENTDAWVSRTYQQGIYLLFTLPAQIIMATIAILGLCAFVWTFQPHLELLNSTHHSLFLIPAAMIAVMATAVFHELAHAYTTKFFGRSVRSFGVGWFWVSPIAFCDTSDMWLSKKSHRVAVDLAGIYWDIFLSGAISLVALWTTGEFISLFLWLLSFILYLGVFANLTPYIELDGYYTLMDLTGIDNLRENATLWLVNDAPATFKNPALFLQHKIYILYWAICILYIALEIIVPYIVMNILLYGLFGVTHPIIAIIVVCLVVIFSTLGIWSDIKKTQVRNK
jgi:CRP-like cAMP-binding protein